MRSVSELVWSPDEGLSIKIAASNLSTRKTSLRWNADTLSIVIPSPQQSGGGGESGDNIDATLEDAEKMPSQLRTRSDSSVRVFMASASPTRIRNLDAQQSTSIRSHGQDSKCCVRMDVMNEGKETSDNFCVDKLEKEDEVGSCPTRYCRDTSRSLGSASRKEIMPIIAEKQAFCATTVHDEKSWAANAWRARLVKAISQKESILPSNADNIHSTSAFGKIGNSANLPGKLTGMLGNRNDSSQDQVMQDNHKDGLVARCDSASAVNPVARRELPAGVNHSARYESTSGYNPRKLEKGKEKLIYDNSNCVSNTNEGDDSNEGIESCPSTKAPKRKHAEFSAAEMPSGNKRYRREDNESSCSGLFYKNDSSFFNWMSTLTNGVKVFDETTAVPLNQKFSAATGEEIPANPVPLQNNSGAPLQSVGFNSLFQSLYSHNVMITSRNTCHQSESSYTANRLTLGLESNKPISMGRETLDVAAETIAAGRIQMDSDGDRGAFQNQIGIFPLRAERNGFHGSSSNSGGEGRIVFSIGDKSKEQLSPGSGEELGEKVLSEREYQNCGGISDGKAVAPKCNLETNAYIEDTDRRRVQNKEGASNSMENQPDNKQLVPYGIVPNDVCDESSAVFGALQRLRLSRSDIIRWLRSPVMHTTLDGFYLRLRFGKWEEALGGTGYHVARINGVLDRNRLSVTIRNSTCQVDSRFVSNQDFHEDELKAWWSAAMKSGWKLPSKELNTKLRERELLRF